MRARLAKSPPKRKKWAYSIVLNAKKWFKSFSPSPYQSHSPTIPEAA